eukprot:TRINITY_DN776_c0_g1_i1.p1 TRINITY_DN776_c0_g1~~TRINITY_DN776_c0_g1_i1.p1  ORF type:complete len:805 (-),score=222.18 TRINITY_DN776_c0_g1_i1:922-3336(-)
MQRGDPAPSGGSSAGSFDGNPTHAFGVSGSWDFVGVPEFDDLFGGEGSSSDASPSPGPISSPSEESNPTSPHHMSLPYTDTIHYTHHNQQPQQYAHPPMLQQYLAVNNFNDMPATKPYATTPTTYSDMHAVTIPTQHHPPSYAVPAHGFSSVANFPAVQPHPIPSHHVSSPPHPSSSPHHTSSPHSSSSSAGGSGRGKAKKAKRTLDDTAPSNAVPNVPDAWDTYTAPNKEHSALYDQAQRELSGSFDFLVQKIDKNAQYSDSDRAWIMYRQNRFQVDCELYGSLTGFSMDPAKQRAQTLYVDSGGLLHEVVNIGFEIYAVKVQSASGDIHDPSSLMPVNAEEAVPLHQVGASRAKRDNKVPEACIVNTGRASWSKLQFSTATGNNARLHPASPNPSQQYFRLVVCMFALGHGGRMFPILARISPPLIVRGQNPGRFMASGSTKTIKDDDMDDISLTWRTDPIDASVVFHQGKVGINTAQPTEALHVAGNALITGSLMKPSDQRIKSDFRAVDGPQALARLQRVKLYDYMREPLMGEDADEPVPERGVIAQELQQVMPEAVRVIGELKLKSGRSVPQALVVNDRVLLFETVSAAQQLAERQDQQEGAMAALSDRLNAVAREGQRQKEAVVSKLSSVVDYMEKDTLQYRQHEQFRRLNDAGLGSAVWSGSSPPYVYFSVCGLGVGWTLLLLGFFLPLLWLFGAMLVFNPSRTKRIPGLANTFMLALLCSALAAICILMPSVDINKLALVALGALWGTGSLLTLALVSVRISRQHREREDIIRHVSGKGYSMLIPRLEASRKYPPI